MGNLKRSISVVIPLFNGEQWIFETLEKLITSLSMSSWEVCEIVVVDDGSTDKSAREILRFNEVHKSEVKIVTQRNSGRLIARINGLQACSGEFVLFLDTRVHLDVKSMHHAYSITESENALTCHINYSKQAPLVGFFWSAAEKIFWSEYWNDPKDSRITSDNFDNFPKGTTSLILRRDLAIEAFANFKPSVSNLQNASDDTQPLCLIAEKYGIFISPKYSATYIPRMYLIGSLKHAFHRGVVFYDGHVTRRSELWKKFSRLSAVSILSIVLILNFIPVRYCILILLIIDILLPIVVYKSIRWKPWISLNLYAIPYTVAWSIGLVKTILKIAGKK